MFKLNVYLKQLGTTISRPSLSSSSASRVKLSTYLIHSPQHSHMCSAIHGNTGMGWQNSYCSITNHLSYCLRIDLKIFSVSNSFQSLKLKFYLIALHEKVGKYVFYNDKHQVYAASFVKHYRIQILPSKLINCRYLTISE